MSQDIKPIIESLLFASETPLSVSRLAEILEHDNVEAVQDAVRRLAEEYHRRQGGFYLCEIAGGYQLRTRPEHKEWIRRMLQSGPSRLSRAAMETLAIVAYKQPVLRSDVEYIRGVDCGGVLRVLLERKIIKILGRKELPGRPLLYGTTRKFLEMFNLKDLRDLPTPKELAPEKSDHSGAPVQNVLRFSEASEDAGEAAGTKYPNPRYLPMIVEQNAPFPEPDFDAPTPPKSESDRPAADDAPGKKHLTGNEETTIDPNYQGD